MIKKTIVKKLISRHGFYDRELLVELMKPNRFGKYLWKWKLYRKFLRLEAEEELKTETKKEINPLERIGNALAPIRTNFFSKILKKMGIR